MQSLGLSPGYIYQITGNIVFIMPSVIPR